MLTTPGEEDIIMSLGRCTDVISFIRLNRLTREVLGFEQTYMYEILVTETLRTSECAGECHFSVKLSKRALYVTADGIVETTCNTDILTINASEDFQ